jgi:ATP-dependent DNA helicase RecG
MKLKGIDDAFCEKIIIDYLRKFGSGKKADFEKILLNKLPDILSEVQKKDKLKNLLQKLRRAGKIENKNRTWQLIKD